MLRDFTGRWILGFSKKLGSSSVLMAELHGILTSLEIAWEQGARHIWIECDSKVVVHLIHDGIAVYHPYYFIIQQIQDFLSRAWSVRISHIW